MSYLSGVEMPKYQCHKQVWALKISGIRREGPPDFTGPVCKGSAVFGSACGHCEKCRWYEEHAAPGYVIVPEDTRYAPFAVDAYFYAKHRPEPGSYYVVYRDGYASVSPGPVFEDGYTRI